MKFKLKQDFLTPDFYENTQILGIMAPIKNYTFCWLVNHQLGLHFKLDTSKQLQLKKKLRNYFFNIYNWNEPMCFLQHYIVQNQYDGEYLLPEYKNMDYIWVMKGDMVEDDKYQWIINSLKNISGVQLVIEIAQDQIKNKKNLIF